MNARRIFVGDVQGCRDALERLLTAVRFDPSADRVCFCGDLVNKGPDNAGVLRLARSLGAESVLGNHDLYLLELAHARAPDDRDHTLDDVLGATDRDELVDWLLHRPLAVHLGDVFLVHAAVRPTWRDLRRMPALLRERFDAEWTAGRSPSGDPDVNFALRARFCTTDGKAADPDWPPPGPPYVNWVDLWPGPEIVVFGHFARQGLRIGDHVRGLDAGCVYGGALAAWIAEEDRVVTVPAR